MDKIIASVWSSPATVPNNRLLAITDSALHKDIRNVHKRKPVLFFFVDMKGLHCRDEAESMVELCAPLMALDADKTKILSFINSDNNANSVAENLCGNELHFGYHNYAWASLTINTCFRRRWSCSYRKAGSKRLLLVLIADSMTSKNKFIGRHGFRQINGDNGDMRKIRSSAGDVGTSAFGKASAQKLTSLLSQIEYTCQRGCKELLKPFACFLNLIFSYSVRMLKDSCQDSGKENV